MRNLSRHKVLDISMGLNHTAVIVEPGHVYTFGRNIEGQLGIGNTKPQNNIMEVKAITEESTVNVRFNALLIFRLLIMTKFSLLVLLNCLCSRH